MTAVHDTLADILAETLYEDLSSPAWRGRATACPFDIDTSVLGDAFTSLSMLHHTSDTRWAALLNQQVSELTDTLYAMPFSRLGVMDGIGGLLLALSIADTYPGAVDISTDTVAALESRLTRLAEDAMGRLRSGIGASFWDYGYGTGLAGLAHHLFVLGRAPRLAQRICDLFADMAESSFPEGFWTPAAELSAETVEAYPELMFGERDLSFGLGVTGIISVLNDAHRNTGNERYLDAASLMLSEVIEDLGHYGGAAISRFQVPSCTGTSVSPTDAEGHTWFSGLPALEMAVAGSDRLTDEFYPSCQPDDAYLDATSGNFDSIGLCHGLAGRLYLADVVGLEEASTWATDLEGALHRYVELDRDDPHRVSADFWDGAGGAAAVWFGRTGADGHAPALRVLGVGQP